MAGKGGRPPAITAEVEHRLLQLLQAGVPKKDAAAACGVGESTLYRYQASSESFRSQVEKAESEAVAANTLVVRKAAQAGTWQAAAWWLERRRPEDWARTERVEVAGKDGGPISVDLRTYSTEQLREIKRVLAGSAQAAGNGRNGTGGEEPL
jgi:hypothetical protein